jgi:predicted O-methyltransferase YrrM
MKFIDVLRRLARNSDETALRLREISELQHKSYDRLAETVAGLDNQSRLINDKLKELIEGIDNQSRLLNDKLKELIDGTISQSSLLYDKLKELTDGTISQSSLLNDKLLAIIDRQNVGIELHKAVINKFSGEAIDLATIQVPPIPNSHISRPAEKLQTALARLPLMIDAKTYNTSHPEYNSALVRNFPGKIFNFDKICTNSVYASLRQLATGDEIPDAIWNQILKEALEEARSIAHSDQVFERRTYIENYMKEITNKYHAHYAAGWVNLDDALFLYWLVRKLKPKIIVQTGVCNGLSSAFMVLALVKNGSEGTLHVIDLPPVFNPNDRGWTIKDKVYGVVIPEGKSSGWIVPDAYRERFEVWNGDAKALLPKMVDQVPSIDLFYHDSDHTYDHMMFEFREAKRKLQAGGLIVADDISWNQSVWDFADEYGVPSYNFKGAVGVAFF